MTDTQSRDWLSQQASADWYDVDVKTIRRAIAEGRLRAYRVGRQIRIRVSDLEAFAEQIPREVA